MTLNPLVPLAYYPPKEGLGSKVRELQEGSALAQRLTPSKEKLELQKACQEFESLFLFYLLKTLRKTIPSGSFLGKSPGKDIYNSLIDQEVAKAMSQRGGIGIAQMLMRELSRSNQNDTLLERKAEEKICSVPKTYTLPPSSSTHHLTGSKLYQSGQNSSARETAHISPSISNQLEEKLESQDQTSWHYPLASKGIITSHYGLRKDPFTGKDCFHAGIDLALMDGAEIKAAYPGKVIFSGWKRGYGNLVVIAHKNDYTTYYAHNSKNLVREGDLIKAGQTIALVGDTGRATGPHLHFEIRESGIPINPTKFIGLKT
jgi:murein DD-endopeptidase MepM/ murein hydrolase activator NlpD